MGKTHLVIPDSHSNPAHNNDRYIWLGHLINDVKPDVVIDIGDWFDMASLSMYDKGKAAFEGRRYRHDINHGIDAQDKLRTVVRSQKRKLPRFVRTLGNHEYRIIRAVERDPILIGTIGLRDLQSAEYGWEEHPFLDPVEIDGVKYCHYFTTGVKNLPVGGNHQAYTLLVKEHASCVMGHTHTRDSCVQRAGAKFIQSLVVGCYQDYDAEWAGPANNKWNRGVYLLHDVEDGQFDEQWISLEKIRAEYKGKGPVE